jgi:hypothetical protein
MVSLDFEPVARLEHEHNWTGFSAKVFSLFRAAKNRRIRRYDEFVSCRQTAPFIDDPG